MVLFGSEWGRHSKQFLTLNRQYRIPRRRVWSVLVHCFNRYRLISASALLCVLTGLFHASDVRAGMIETPYDSLNWQTSEWGPECNGVRLRVSIPSEIDYGEPIVSILDLSIDPARLCENGQNAPKLELAGARLFLSPAGDTSYKTYTGHSDRRPRRVKVSCPRSRQAGIIEELGVGNFIFSCANYGPEWIGSFKPAGRRTLIIHAGGVKPGEYECRLEATVTSLGSVRDQWDLPSGMIRVRVMPRIWVTYPVCVIFPAVYHRIGDSVLEADPQLLDTTIIRLTGNMYYGLIEFDGAGGGLSGFTDRPPNLKISLPAQRFRTTRIPGSRGSFDRSSLGFRVFEADCTPGHFWSPHTCPWYREVFHHNPLDWRAPKVH